jgi:hypothetical protein
MAGHKLLQFSQSGEHLTILVPAEAPDANATVIALLTCK